MNVKLSNSQFSKLKSAIKNENDVVLRISSNMIGNSDDNSNFPHELLLTDRLKGSSDGRVVPLTKKEYGSLVYFL